MNDAVFWPDVSHYQVPVNGSFTGRFLMYKISEGTTYVDPNCEHNTAWCDGNAGPGKKLIGHGGYHVWTPGDEETQAARFFAHAKVGRYFVAMIDVESWGGKYHGDHSASITKLVNVFAAKLGQRRVKVYGNSGDLAQLYPTRPSWLGLVKAKYSSFAPAEPWVGWQYTDGSTNWGVPQRWPRASAPFGNCDHNVFLGTLAQFAAAWGLPDPTPPKPVSAEPAVHPGPIHIPEGAPTMYGYLHTYAGAGKPGWKGTWLIAPDLRSKTHVTDPTSHAFLKASKLYAPSGLTDAQADAVPNAS